MSVRNVKSAVDIQRLPVDSEEHKIHDWTIKYKQSHILHSQCSAPFLCNSGVKEKCQFCVYSSTLDLPHMPDMVFPNNILSIQHASGAALEFNALDALKVVVNGKLPIQIACAEIWQESRSETHLEQKVKSFDWTFSTDYKGTLVNITSMPTEERIDMEKLKEREKIMFYHEMTLFEDELHDNGIASCSVKIRVMPNSYFVLLRYFLRVDNVLVKINDTRFYHEFKKDYIIREYTTRESGVKELGLPLQMFSDANVISPHLPITVSIYEKLVWSSGMNEDATQ